MVRFPRGWRLLVTICALLAGVAKCAAGDVESRLFKITVDGKDAGAYAMTISADKEGVLTMTGQADVKVRYLGGLYTYKYSYSGEETWKDGRLRRFASKC